MRNCTEEFVKLNLTKVMTPKEKAKELISKFNFKHLGDRYILYQTVEESKRCALIAVDEILEYEKIIVERMEAVVILRNARFICQALYWQDVKQELEKL